MYNISVKIIDNSCLTFKSLIEIISISDFSYKTHFFRDFLLAFICFLVPRLEPALFEDVK